MKKVLSISLCIMALVVIAIWAPGASAYQFYSDATNDQGGCAQCHTGFRDNNNYFSNAEGVSWGTSLHNVHLNNTNITSVGGGCDNCHGGVGTAGRTVRINSSLGAADGVNAIACTGCHVPEGLRAHHAANGVTLCAGCHSDPAPATEDVAPPWYGSIINDITGTNLAPCNENGEEQLAGDTIGLDNDGDNAYDTADPDCDVCIPTGLPDDNCDGIDDDCNGTADDAYVPTQTFCGVGVCANTGLLECQDGQLVDNCVELPQDEATDVTCDGRDGDCDGSIDEDYTPISTTCGVGECAGNTGAEECQSGVIVDTCDPLAGAAADDATCDGLDNDCDGAVDEDYAPMATTCGVGECAATGATTCTDGVEGDTCTPGTPAADDATCDGLDNDCDGAIDEDYTPMATTCGVGECAATGATTCVGGVEGDTCTPGTPAADDATCDGLDNDCDGAIDEDYSPMATTCGVGECAAAGATTCVGGVESDTCTPGTPAADDATCDGLDNDCDGTVDEDFASTPTSCGVGECAAAGATTCVGGVEGDTCTPGTPGTEVCDEGNLDEDCDGQANEGCDCIDGDTRSTTCGAGECAATGIETCTGGVWGSDTCTPGTPAADDATCDGLDNDCDGAIDEDYAPMATTCGVGECAATGATTCVGGVESDTCTPGTPAADDATCDGLDNDCDGAVDEDFASTPTSCGVGECAAAGDTTCVGGVEGDTCTPGTPAADDATCDGLDNDCDGAVDEDYAPMATTCGVGECAATGATTCVGGVESDTCTPGTPAADDATCDGLDNDCDGAVDEDYMPMATTCGVGECAAAGDTTCVGGVEGDTCTPGTPGTEVCDEGILDEDCDGQANEGCDCIDGDTRSTTCGAGECAATGIETCTGGVWGSDTCTPGTPAADDATCDGLDNDCDGAIDEDYAPMATTCGVGECAATGATTCVGGVESDTCTPGTPAADDATCDGLDNDCDGAVDEDFASTPTSCGVGECAAAGDTTCVGGVEGDTCTPGTPAADDATCDGLDNDCDGAVDEDYAPMATTCGVGECAATGATTCVGGVESDTCTPGTPAADDATCDGLDNDCDGAVDEDYMPMATTCGVGECAATGATTCVGGVEGDTCTPGTPAADDATCDGLDNDCDGAIDEDYAPMATTCGVGECAATGATTCVGGVESDTCTPGTPAADDATCDGLDNDCDGAVDEDFASTPTSCGVGECAAAGDTTCVGGVEGDTCTPGTPAADDATCDGLDNDCDGAVDEDYMPMATTCGVGECAAAGDTTCVGGVEGDTCTPGTPGTEVCDEGILDEDCDGQANEGCDCIDGDTRSTTCGAGECAATGIETCTGGVWGSDTCTPGTPAADDATCDGLDNDCDGAIDEDYAPMATTCGVGECAATGATTCVGGVESDTCTPGTPAADDATCDGLDNDCDGAVDEDFASTPTSCGVGECAAAGDTTCVGGVEGDTCTPGTPAADDATCDGLDNDCDGAVDEDYAPMATTCGVGECAATGATTCVGGVESDTCTPGTPAADDATCDGLDNDCDGAVDEDYMPMATTCGVGECAAAGDTTCVGGVEGDTCTPGTPGTEVCDEGNLDEDCDGQANEGCDCIDGDTRSTTCGAGECAATGIETCTGGVWGSDTCTPGTPAADDATCDGLDNDCDGAIDEDFASTPTTCGIGECAATGATTCTDGVEGDTCTPGTPAADDATCDGLDNDCDGAVDEDYAPMATTCGVGECTATGATTCVGGSEGDTCTPGIPGTEVCDEGILDEDCDGQANEGCDCIDGDTRPTTCGAGECAATGIETCTSGVWGNDTCTPGTPAADDATCDGLDNDCDGAIDEDYAPMATACGVGECAATGATTCVGGVESDTCTPGTPAADDATCDGLDNDCDGAIDEDYAPMATTCGVGECAATGATTCVGGVESDTCTPGTPAADDATCDALDNDCDGAVDEDYAPMATTCGVGECAATGATTCVGGVEGDTCTPGTPAADDATCDGLDNDCDGAVDEDYMPMATTCGVGECTATGATTCVGGSEGDTCTPGTPGTEICDEGNLDEDCDGQANEGCDCIDGDTRSTTCGAGECAATGIESCTGGVWANDTCTPGTPAADDATCDGLDNDCDGTVDEDYMPIATTCGIGECAAAGATTCVGGIEGDTCTPGTPAADDATCDGLDNDCDGAIDEDFASTPTSCGVGECAATGATTCVGGVEGDTCTPGTPAADDATCDGLDNDCDGAIDEDFASTPTTCGIGECAATGATTCTDGVEGDTCTPGSPTEDTEVTCDDGVDNDCDGLTDDFDPDCSVEPQNELIWAAGKFGTILNTTDGGANWSAQNSGTSDEIFALDFFDANTGWAVGWRGTILNTTDGGANWSAQKSGTRNLNDLDFIDANTGWAAGDFGTILKTTDGGANWSAQNSGTSEWLNGLDFIDANTGWAVGDFAIMLKTIDGGANWSAQNSGTSADLNDLYFIDASTGWAVGGSGTILKTIDGGANWSAQNSGTRALNDLDFIDANTGWAVGNFGAILKTTDGGANWSAQNSGTGADLNDLDFIDANTGWAVGWQGTILKTTDGGANWSAQTSGTSRNLNTLAIAPDVTTVPGDCNGDGLVDAGDISAVVLEIFDGDGTLPADTPGGRFPGNAAGCDANVDGIVDAGDSSCTVLLIFNGQGACGG